MNRCTNIITRALLLTQVLAYSPALPFPSFAASYFIPLALLPNLSFFFSSSHFRFDDAQVHGEGGKNKEKGEDSRRPL
jgi:hypothetical protein